MAELRVIDAGRVGPLRSQALWHGLASAMGSEASPVLSLCRPARPYVSLGFHRSLAEIDREACRRRGWPVIRRQIGGGPVYLDSDQLFFQITLPARLAPPRVDRLYRSLLAPAIEAFRALGIAAALRGTNDIAIGDRRLSGTGAGRLGEAVTVVGNVIFDFPHARMTECLALPDAEMKSECLRLMRRHVTSLAREGRGGVTFEEARRALIEAYGRGLGGAARRARPSTAEQAAIAGWERRLASADWLRGPRPRHPWGRRVKICAGVWVFAAAGGGLAVRFSVIDGRLRHVRVEGGALNGDGGRLVEALEGSPSRPAPLGQKLRPFGDLGSRLLALLEPGLAAH